MKHRSGHLTVSALMVRRLAVAVASAALFLTATLPVLAQDAKAKDERVEISTPWGGLTASEKASLQEVGLPAYPKARAHKDSPTDESEAKLSFWTRSMGMKLVVMKFESEDAVEKVSTFYQKALAKYGKVLVCTGAEAKKKSKDEDSEELTCDDSEPDAGGVELRGGTKEKRRIVAIGPSKAGKGAEFALVYLEFRKEPRGAQ
jgi:hypothetical protein